MEIAMDDTTSLSSLNSADFILIGKEPKLQVAAGGGSTDLEKNMAEILNESTDSSQFEKTLVVTPPTSLPSSPDDTAQNSGDNNTTPIGSMNDSNQFEEHQKKLNEHEINIDNNDDTSSIASSTAGDLTRPIQNARPYLGNSVLFHGVTYLGSASINAPRSEEELNRNMAILNEQSKMSIEVTLCVPDSAEGLVRLLDPQTEIEIISYRICQILFCARGQTNTSEACCFAFTTGYSSTKTNTSPTTNIQETKTELLYQCQVFRCDLQDAIYRILLSFANAFRRTSSTSQQSLSQQPSQPSTVKTGRTQSLIGAIQAATQTQSQLQHHLKPSDSLIKFKTYLDIKEDDGKGNFVSVQRPDKNVFKLRKDVRKKVSVALQQLRGAPLNIERCFGMLLAQGRNVRASDMQLLDMETMGKSPDEKYYMVRGNWDPLARSFKELVHLNEETPKNARVFLTIAVDLVISGIQEPVRFRIETKARICYPNENSNELSDAFWSSFKKLTPLSEEFDMKLKEAQTKNSQQDASYEVISLESKSEMERKVKLQAAMRNQQNGGTSSDDEPIASGFGVVSKECSEDILDNWSDILLKWRKNYSERPRGLQTLVRKGVPEALRGEVWQLLAGSTGKEFEMIDTYRLLLTKESASERVILNDLNRTFPAHEYFKEVGGIGQEALYKLSRAYSVRDEEVGYCQGLSFVIATLLIHMPEEQAFMLLCKMMEDPRYDLREMYKASFENLQMRFHQLHCLMRDNLPELYDHFDDLKLLCHMYASQWFLTLFTAKFPLYLVFRIMDLFLYEGFNSLFAVGLALLKCAQKDLLVLDFEGVMRYFRVSLPKKYRCEDHADELIQTACSMKISPKKLKRYEKEHYELKALEEQGDEPLNRLECDNKRLQGTCIRLELENEMLALELVNDRVKLKEKIDKSDDRIETLARELTATRTIVRESELHTIRINEELENIKEAFRQTCNELQQTQKIVTDYKQICSQLNDQLEIQSNMYKGKLEIIQDRLSNCCDSCKLVLMPDTGDNISLGTTPLLSSSPKQHTFYNSTITNTPDYSNFAADYELKVRQVENELAEKKLQLTQALCENQELLHQLRTVTEQKCLDYNNIPTTSADFIRQSQQGNSSTNSWLSKTVNTIKEATRSSSGSIKFS